MAIVTATFKVETTDTSAPIDGVIVRVFDSNDDLYAELLTGVPIAGSGETETLIDADVGGTPYTIRLYSPGLSFLPGASNAVLIADPPLPAGNDFLFTAYPGATAEIVTIVVTESGNPLEGVDIRVYDAADSFLTEGQTDALGEFQVTLEGDPDPGRTYIIRSTKSGVVFTGGPTKLIQVKQPLVAPDTNIFDIFGEIPSIPESITPGVCRITGSLVSAGFKVAVDAKIRFILRPVVPSVRTGGILFPHQPSVVNRNIIVKEGIAAVDENGNIDIELPRGTCFDVHVYGLESVGMHDGYFETVYIPDRAGALLEDVLLPYAESLTYDSTPVNMSVDTTLDLDFEATDVLGVVVTGAELLAGMFEVSSTDPDVATAGFTDNGTLTISAISVGVATLSFSRVGDTFAERHPTIPDLVQTPIDVTVTP